MAPESAPRAPSEEPISAQDRPRAGGPAVPRVVSPHMKAESRLTRGRSSAFQVIPDLAAQMERT